MLKTLQLLTFLLLTSAVAFGTANTASAAERPATDLFQLASHPSDRVCCKRGWRDWWTTRYQCRRAGGYVTRNRECRDDRADYRVCCKRGWRDWWTTAHQCRRAGGYAVSPRECRDDRRICCKRGRRDWWSTPRECRRAGGYITSNRECRDDWRDHRHRAY